jgi:hypothetical protein
MATPTRGAALPLALALAMGSAVCLGKVYQWTDADGNVQFSDHPQEAAAGQALPKGAAATTQSRPQSGWSVQVEPVDFRLHEPIGDMIGSVPRAVYGIMRERLGLDLPDLPTLTVRLVRDQDAYVRVVGPEHGRSEPDGTYRPESNEILTWYRQSPDAMAQYLAGESGRVLLRTRFPQAPTWLHEGLAHYFELLRVLGDAAAVFPDPQFDREVAALRDAQRLLPTGELVALSAPEWRQANQPDQRARVQSWSLVYFLLSTPEGGRLIAELLRRSAPGAGTPPDSTPVIDARFAGGVSGLDSRWRDWLSSHKAAHYY